LEKKLGCTLMKEHQAEIAQLVEHATENRGVASSILALGTPGLKVGLVLRV
jgi:hypothetical protein